jgi:hypothetical protein
MAMFTPAEIATLAPHVTNIDSPVFALVNLPETVKGALFARYSRSPKSLRRLFLDEFADKVGDAGTSEARADVGVARAEKLYQRVFNDYGDDSVAQLGGVHLAVEDASNVLTKILERGRLMAYLEQSTRYIPYTDRRDGRWRYLVPAELDGHPLREEYIAAMDAAFEVYARWIDPMRAWFEARYPRADGDSEGQGARHAAWPAAGRDPVERGHLRHGPGIRGAAAAHARPSARRGARDRRPDAGRAAEGHPGVSHARRSAGPWRAVEPVLRRHP